MFTQLITEYATRFLEYGGYAAAATLMAAESMILPVPSEAVMPFVGFLVADGKWDLTYAILFTSIGSIVGSLLSYVMGYYGGKPVVLKVGKYLLLDRHDLEITEKFFHRRAGVVTLFISRFIPVVRHLISIPAGVGRMKLLPFCVATLVGATMWNSFLLWCGYVLRRKWKDVEEYSSQIDIVVVVLLVGGLTWWIWHRLRRRRAAH
jgi:membrane protein DedA with SNARE-associated domain